MHPAPRPAAIGGAAQTRISRKAAAAEDAAGEAAAAAVAAESFAAAEGHGGMQAPLRRRSSGMPSDLDDEVVQLRCPTASYAASMKHRIQFNRA